MPSVFTAPARACCAAWLAAPAMALAAPQYIAHEIQDPQGHSLYAFALNDHAQVVGRTNAKRYVRDAQAFFAGRHTYTSQAVFGGDFSFARAINNAGDIAGHYLRDKSDFRPRAFIQQRGQAPLELFADDAAWASEVSGINRQGMVVGTVQLTPTSNWQAFSWQGGQATLLVNAFGGVYSDAEAVNDSGVVVGTATDSVGFMHAFRHERGKMVALPSLLPYSSAPGDVAYAVNAAGDAVGSCAVVNFFRHACLWKDGGVTDLGVLPGAGWSQAFGINDAGVAVGRSDGDGRSVHAVIFRDGQVMDLDPLTTLPPGVHLDVAIAINKAGQIVAQGKDAKGRHSYWLEPVPAH